MSEILLKECFLCWKAIENLNHETDCDNTLYKLNEEQIDSCNKYLQAEILEYCEKQNNLRLLWETQIFCLKCFEASESLAATHEVLLDVQNQLKDIVELFNLEIIKERQKKFNSTLDYHGKSDNDNHDECYSDDGVNEEYSENTAADCFQHVDEQNSETQNNYVKDADAEVISNYPNLKDESKNSKKLAVTVKQKSIIVPQNKIQPGKKTKVLVKIIQSDEVDKAVTTETLTSNQKYETDLFLVTSDEREKLSDDFEIKEEPLPFKNYSPLFHHDKNENFVENSNSPPSNNCGIKAIIKSAKGDIEHPKKLGVLCKQELRIKLKKLQFDSNGKVVMPVETKRNVCTGNRTKRKAAAKAIELIKVSRDSRDEAEGGGSDDNNNTKDDSDNEFESESSSDEELDNGHEKKTNVNNRETNLVKKSSTKPREGSSSEKSNLLQRKYHVKRSAWLSQLRLKQGDAQQEEKPKDYFCGICNRTFSYTGKHRHMRTHTKEKRHVCVECGKTFGRPEALRKHMKNVHITESKFSCERCDEKFKIIEDLSKHMRNHTIVDFVTNCDKGKHYQCNLCDESFEKNDLNLELFIAHMFTHGLYKCIICKKKFDTKDSLKDHHLEEHSDGYPCSVCPHKAATLPAMRSHARRHEKEDHVCEDCGAIYKSITVFKNHRREKHAVNAEKLFKCKIKGCDRAYVTKRQLLGHKKSHVDQQCEVCGVNVKNILAHMNTHNEIPFECDVCGKKFKKLVTMKEHKQVVHEGKKNTCTVCGKELASKTSLFQHMKKHDEKPYECSECGKSFYRQDNLTTHMRFHTGEKPYKCDKCGKQFSRKDNLNTHAKKCVSPKEKVSNDLQNSTS